jgi:hypothetical protein
MGGVTVIVDETLTKYVKQICVDFEFGIVLIIDKCVFNLDSDCLFVSLYIPPENSPFYEQHVLCGINAFEDLYTSNDLTRLHLILNGDMNARTGNGDDFISFSENIPELNEYADNFDNDIGVVRSNSDRKVNKFGRMLLQFCKTYSCYIVNGRYGKDAGKGEFTFLNENGCSTIDYFILSKKVIEIVSDFEVLSHAESCHSPIYIELAAKQNTSKASKDLNLADKTWYKINENNSGGYLQNMSENIENGCFDTFESLLGNGDSSIDVVLKSLEDAILQCTEIYKRCQKRDSIKQNKDWFDKECKQQKGVVNSNLRLFRTSRTERDLNIYLLSKKQYKSLCKRKKEIYYRTYIDKVERSTSTKSFWKELKGLLSKPKPKDNVSTDRWYDHFSSLFALAQEVQEEDREQSATDLEELEPDDPANILFNSSISDDEILGAVNSLKVNKASSGNLTANMIKYGINALLPYIRVFFNRLYSRGEFPEAWAKFIIVPIHKKGNVDEPNNYRGIALLDIVSKIYINILSKRLTFYVEAYSKLSESQSGFRCGYSTMDNAFALYSVISKYLNRKKRPVYVAFVDFEKAFDSVERTILYSAIQKYGIRGNLFKSIEAIYENVTASVRVSDHLTNEFACPVGLRQGCPLSPILFCLFINELHDLLIRNETRGIQLQPSIIELFLLMFADDIAFIADTISNLQKQLNILQSFCDQSKLKVNVNKTKIVVFKRGGQLSRRERWTYNNNEIEVVSGFTYVGVYFTNRLSLHKMAESMS